MQPCQIGLWVKGPTKPYPGPPGWRLRVGLTTLPCWKVAKKIVSSMIFVKMCAWNRMATLPPPLQFQLKDQKFPYSKITLRAQRRHSWFVFLAELWRPEGLPSGAPYPYRKEKVTHEWIFSWLSWLAVLLVGVYTWWRRQRQRSRTSWWPYCKW